MGAGRGEGTMRLERSIDTMSEEESEEESEERAESEEGAESESEEGAEVGVFLTGRDFRALRRALRSRGRWDSSGTPPGGPEDEEEKDKEGGREEGRGGGRETPESPAMEDATGTDRRQHRRADAAATRGSDLRNDAGVFMSPVNCNPRDLMQPNFLFCYLRWRGIHQLNTRLSDAVRALARNTSKQ